MLVDPAQIGGANELTPDGVDHLVQVSLARFPARLAKGCVAPVRGRQPVFSAPGIKGGAAGPKRADDHLMQHCAGLEFYCFLCHLILTN